MGNVQYIGKPNQFGDDVATIDVALDDGVSPVVDAGPIRIDIVGINDAPEITGFPGTISAPQNTPTILNFSKASVADVDVDTCS